MNVEKAEIVTLSADPSNVRKHGDKNLEAIKASLRRFGQQKPIVVDADGIVRAGNGTLAAAIQLGWTHIDVVRTGLRGSEATAYAIADNRTAELATWDVDALSRQLESLRLEDPELPAFVGFSEEDVAMLEDGVVEKGEEAASTGSDINDGFYTSTVDSIVYEITGDRPSVSQLFDTATRDKLVSRINASEVDPQVKDFLIAAANRHVVFNYSNIAEFYAHADGELQNLMEESALVIIDYDRAAEMGFVKMNRILGELAEVEEDAQQSLNGGDQDEA